MHRIVAFNALRAFILVVSIGGLHSPARATPDGAWEEQPPLHRTAHTAVYDALRDRMILVGGVIENYAGDPAYDGSTSDVWILDLANPSQWARLDVAGTTPPRRSDPALVYDTARDRLILFGGKGDAVDDEVWMLSLAGTPTWIQQATSGGSPGIRSAAGAAYDPVRDRLVLFGGKILPARRTTTCGRFRCRPSRGRKWLPPAPRHRRVPARRSATTPRAIRS